ncbi:hypothetical protein RXV86_05425 [Alisedimentitalea sp. MJ-SS2]|uniref:hypothetical protein n=1 Tax=Aliisedimentitalea sp. MJ-SS2 TaxID=3049795 RepID=UPI00290637DC|nr:hypothetical protein [Alisedimentitalea sp. MJ-SS2]MDU8926815.1 hypothetical protein [Alisedimentitalea sp. MJ-SS2]
MRDSFLNPGNWFGRSRAEAVDEGPVNPLIPKSRGLFRRKAEEEYRGIVIDTIAELRIERATDGAIIQVKGIANTQGWHNARLIEEEDDGSDTTLTYTLQAQRSPYRELIGPPQGREIVVAKVVTENDLAGIRVIRVKGAKNARSSRRR